MQEVVVAGVKGEEARKKGGKESEKKGKRSRENNRKEKGEVCKKGMGGEGYRRKEEAEEEGHEVACAGGEGDFV